MATTRTSRPSRSALFLAPVQYVKGVGPTRAEQLARLGIATVEDLFYHRPRRYEDRRRLATIAQLRFGQKQSTQGTVVALSERRHGTYQFHAAISDETGVLQCTWYGQRYLRQVIRRGTRLIVFGRIERRDTLIMIVEDFEILTGDEEDTLHTGRIVPVHRGTDGLSPRVLRTIMHQALAACADDVPEIIPDEMRRRNGLLERRRAVRQLHFPSTLAEADAARRRLAFDELLMLQLGVLMRRQELEQIDKGYRYAVGDATFHDFLARLPFSLTGAQRRVLDEIVRDLRRSSPMNRLLQGDVGSGKTIVAAAALYLAVRGGHQGALMAPTEILAEQHYLTFRRMLGPLGISIALVSGGRSKRDRDQIRDALRTGALDIAIGTHALIETGIEFKHLGLIVVDEQHKFGVAQRALLRQKGFHPDVLVMTATPIPRTLTMTLYGDLDVSVLDEMPPGRGAVRTFVRGPEKRPDVYAWVLERVREGQQAYIVCPLIEESEKLQVEAAVALADRLRRDVFADVPVGLLHGRLRPDEKDAVMEQFRRGDLRVLVATSVIEVGIDIPQATIMVIEDAERFGLAQLHQMRGRIGRGKQTSYCVLLASTSTEASRRRMDTMVATRDGFAIAQADLDLRGPGEILGTRQHGLPDLRVADLIEDLPMLETARHEAARLLQQDPALSDADLEPLRDEVRAKFDGRMAALSAG